MMRESAVSKISNTLAGDSRRAGAFIFAVAWLLRVAVVLFTRSYKDPQPVVEMGHVVLSIVAGLGFSNPFGCVTGPTSHLAPVFPYLLSLIYRVLPAGDARELAVKIFRITLVSLAYALLPWLAVRLRLNRGVGVFAGLFAAAVPLLFWMEVRQDWEGPLTALLIIVGLGMFARLLDEPGTWQAVATGLLWGVSLLNAPTLLFTFAALVAFWIWRGQSRTMAKLRLLPALLLPLILVMTPWTVRNYRVFHHFMFVRQNLGLELHLSFNPVSQATYFDTFVAGVRDHPSTDPATCADFARLGEISMNRLDQQKGLAWIRTNRGRFAELIAGRFVAFWVMDLANLPRTLASGALTLAGLLGLVLCFSRYRFAAQLLGITLLAFPLTYYVFQFDARYRYPLHPIVVLLACVFLTEAGSALRRRQRPVSD